MKLTTHLDRIAKAAQDLIPHVPHAALGTGTVKDQAFCPFHSATKVCDGTEIGLAVDVCLYRCLDEDVFVVRGERVCQYLIGALVSEEENTDGG